MTPMTFTKAQHLRAKADFERVYARKCKAADGTMLLFADRRETPLTRVGLSVSKKHGGAVVRNRLKRLLREAFRLTQHELPPGMDLIAIPLSREKAGLLAYEESFRKLTQKLARRLEQSDEAPR